MNISTSRYRSCAKADDGGVELKVHIHSVPPTAECFGTADFVAVIGRKLTVVDLKFGKGVRVNVANNSQAMFYALAVVESLHLEDHIDEIEIIVCQPRIDGAERQTWTIDLDRPVDVARQQTHPGGAAHPRWRPKPPGWPVVPVLPGPIHLPAQARAGDDGG